MLSVEVTFALLLFLSPSLVRLLQFSISASIFSLLSHIFSSYLHNYSKIILTSTPYKQRGTDFAVPKASSKKMKYISVSEEPEEKAKKARKKSEE